MTPFFKEVLRAVSANGGFFNAHLHLDRAGTYHRAVEILSSFDSRDPTTLSLAGKHATIPLVHASDCYDADVLLERSSYYIREMIDCGTARADTVVDTTTDRVGLSALECFLRLKSDFSSKIDLRVGAYSPLGYRDDEPQRWSLLEAGAQLADFIGLLPERDDREVYPDHIGFEESCRRAISLAAEIGKPLHIHVDQANHAHEAGSEIVARVCRELGIIVPAEDEPLIWLVHVISPSAYAETRFIALANELSDLNIGVICCPSAAISMRQIRSLSAPTHNSIARVLELVSAGVFVRIGSDNVCDITSPFGTPHLMDEVRVLGDALRFYDAEFLARTAAGRKADAACVARIRRHLASDKESVEQIVSRLKA